MIAFLIYKSILVVAVFGVSLLVAMYSTYAERKVAAFLQDRLGPNRAGPFGILQPLADGVKMFMKEEIIPGVSNKSLFIVGPSIAMLTACMTGVVIPWGGTLTINGTQYPMQITDINIGILYLLGVVSIGVYGIMIGGWASNNKYSLLGAIRASSQMISYELAMGFAIIALVMHTGTLSLRDIAAMQTGWHWNIIYQPLGFLIFIICAFAETNRAPF
ncbi:MAG: NADH-quinone oxidoreductase subunit H, partial [Bacteroidia bacterium]|nr:NADH-quinone oxidoreductase subunit H [Bacteroidia bacterium]